MGEEPLTPYEVHLKEHFLSRMRPELVQLVKQSCVTWKTCSLSSILQHAEHAEELLRQRKLEDTQLAMFNACTPVTSRPIPGGAELEPEGGGDVDGADRREILMFATFVVGVDIVRKNVPKN